MITTNLEILEILELEPDVKIQNDLEKDLQVIN